VASETACTFLTFFNVFFKIQKNMTFYVFLIVLHVFSNASAAICSRCNDRTSTFATAYKYLYGVKLVLQFRQTAMHYSTLLFKVKLHGIYVSIISYCSIVIDHFNGLVEQLVHSCVTYQSDNKFQMK